MLESISSSFLLVAASEMGDKTQLLAFSLAAKYKKPWPIMCGIFVATIFNHALASWGGVWVAEQISPLWMANILGVIFIFFAFWTLKPDQDEGLKQNLKYGPFLTTTVLFFIAEMGDKTQLATVALGAEFKSTMAVTFGTTLGMMLTDGLAVVAGDQLAHKVNMKYMRWFAASLFLVFGLMSFSWRDAFSFCSSWLF